MHLKMMRPFSALLALLLWAAPAWNEEEFLPPEQAFPVSAQVEDPETLVISWDIAKGYYLYRSKFRFRSKTEGIALGEPQIPPGTVHQDPFFGEVATLRDRVAVRLPLLRTQDGPNRLELETTVQGCADQGLCYPPLHQSLALDLPPLPKPEIALSTILKPPAVPVSPLAQNPLAQRLGFNALEDDLLPAEQAYRFSAQVLDPETLILHWDIAEGTFLYQENLQLFLENAEGVQLGAYTLPPAQVKADTVRPDGEIGEVAIYHGSLDVQVPLLRTDPAPQTIDLVAKYQGCAERGVCYPPQTARVRLKLPAATSSPAQPAASGPAVNTSQAAPSASTPQPPRSETDRIAATLAQGNFWTAVGLFFLSGLLLAFTPCVFPMIPILSGIIAGQGEGLTTFKAFWMSLVYVLSMSLTYALVGLLAGFGGANLQVDFQTPWIISLFALVFVALALSMFGFYDLQLPSSLQSKLSTWSSRQQGGNLLGVGIMGVLSALIVGPCVAPPLAGALLFIGQSGDAWLGFSALFALGLGMGAPLLVIGTSAGKLLPKAGPWMNAVKAVFGVGLLAVAIVLLERILPPALAMALWAALLIVSAVYLGVGQSLPPEASGWQKFWKGLGLLALTYGILMLIGAAAGGKDTVQPLRGLGFSSGTAAHRETARFQRIKTTRDLDRALAEAKRQGKPVLLDFYADWCVSCKEMERYTFSDPEVAAEMQRFLLLQADVTANDAEDQALLQGRFGLPGPPAILFFDAQGRELRDRRAVGFLSKDEFLPLLRSIQP